MNVSQQYIVNLHDSFVKFVNDTLLLINSLLALPQATEEDRLAMNIIKEFLIGNDVIDIKNRLTESTIRCSTLDKIEKVYKDLVDLAIDHLHESPIFKQFLKNLSHAQIEQNKRIETERLKMLGILVNET
ncbi:MAG: hypothetical protein J6Y78_06705 [Paludibacteraceae bacterium]|nr:hypothetical protein [Paludibacteraceae bacterium]